MAAIGCQSRVVDVTCVVIGWILLAAMTSDACDFPMAVQSGWNGAPRREWHGHLTRHFKDRATSYSYIISFQGDTMKAAVHGARKMRDPPKPYTRQCIDEVFPDRFLVLHREADQEIDMFICMQFIMRAGDVMQIRSSREAKRNHPKLCKERNLHLEPWPYINKENIFETYEECPLLGGYNIKVYDKTKEQGICDAYTGETRLESECMEGEGMMFRFRYDTCVPDEINMAKTQRVYCMATWTEGENTFSVLRHSHHFHHWCFRYPTRAGNQFIAFLFKDLNCDTRSYMEMNPDYLQLDMSRDEVRPLSSLCADDYEACNLWSNPCRHAGSPMSLSCARTCGLCSDTRPGTCSFPSKLHGDWEDVQGEEKGTVHVSDSHLEVAGLRQMQCIQWSDGFYFNDDTAFEQMLVTTFSNGCRPRYQCAHFQKRTPSILRFKLSQSQIWPFEGITGQFVNCVALRYMDDHSPLHDKYRSRHFKVLVSATERIYVNCKLTEPKEFTATFADGTICNGSLTSDELSTNNRMMMTVDDCDAPVLPDQTFACLDSWKHGNNGDKMIVTEAQDRSSKLGCWYFPAHPGDTFYLLPASQCNGGVRDKIDTGEVHVDISFVVRKRPFPFEVGSKVRENEMLGGARADDAFNDGGDRERKVDVIIDYGQEEKGTLEQRDGRREAPNIDSPGRGCTCTQPTNILILALLLSILSVVQR